MGEWFSFDGRVRRSTFWVNSIICWIILFIVGLLFVDTRFTLYDGYVSRVSNIPIYYGVSIIVLVRWLSISARRWQDQDKEKEWTAIWFVPVLFTLWPNLNNTELGAILLFVGAIAGLIAVGFQGFVPGDDGENAYGPAPVEDVWV